MYFKYLLWYNTGNIVENENDINVLHASYQNCFQNRSDIVVHTFIFIPTSKIKIFMQLNIHFCNDDYFKKYFKT